mgnify:CR=1 FL=1
MKRRKDELNKLATEFKTKKEAIKNEIKSKLKELNSTYESILKTDDSTDELAGLNQTVRDNLAIIDARKPLLNEYAVLELYHTILKNNLEGNEFTEKKLLEYLLIYLNTLDSAKQLEAVAARPEVTETGKGQMARSIRKNQERRQKEWDEAFGDTHNADGSVMMSTDEMLSPDGIAASPSMDNASPSIPMNNSAQVENESDAVTSGQREQNRAEIQQAMAGAVGASNNTLPYQPEVSVNVTSPKTSLPNNNAELLFIGNNVKHLV